jgi:DNA polymerase-3 subunit alpha
MHAGGVLIAPGKLTDFCPLYAAGGAESAVSQFDKDDVEKAGLVKFDFLGLRTLTILAEAVRFVKEVEDVDIDLDTLPLDDKPTYDRIFKTANTTAVFQFESRGMKDTLVQAKPDRLEDLIALNALYRPGPMDFIPNFIARKHGRERIVYPHPLLEKVLGNTYGIMVYQEQVMQTAQVVAGYSLGGADLLRRAMGKKKPEEMAKQRASSSRARRRTASAPQGQRDLRHHGEVRRLRLQQVARRRLLAGRLPDGVAQVPPPGGLHGGDAVLGNGRHRQGAVLRRRRRVNGLTFLPPDVNRSRYRFTPVDAKTIRYGLGAIKGTGESAIGAIARARGRRRFRGPVRFLPAHRQARGQPPRHRGADPRRRLRFHRRPPFQA